MQPLSSKEKAKELVELFRKDAKLRNSGFLVANENHSFYHSKRCALICINEMIVSMEFLMIDNMDNDSIMKRLNVLDEIQREILKL